MKDVFTDEAIVDGLRRRDPVLTNRIVTFLYKTYQAGTTWMVCQNSGTPNDGDDLFQEVIQVFLNKVWQDVFVFRHEGSVGPFLRETAHRLWRKELARRKAHTRQNGLFGSLFGDKIDYNTPENQYFDGEEIEQGLLLLDRLSETDRQILEAYYGEKMTMQELVDAFGLHNPANAKVRKWRAVQAFKKLMKRL